MSNLKALLKALEHKFNFAVQISIFITPPPSLRAIKMIKVFA